MEAARRQITHPIAGDILLVRDLPSGLPGWTYDEEADVWWHVFGVGEMWPTFQCFIVRPVYDG